MNQQRLAQLRTLMAADPNDPFLPYAIAQEYASAELWKEAIAQFAALKEQFPDYLPTYYQYGIALVKMNQIKQAVYIFQLGLGLARRNKDHKTAMEIEALLEDLE